MAATAAAACVCAKNLIMPAQNSRTRRSVRGERNVGGGLGYIIGLGGECANKTNMF